MKIGNRLVGGSYPTYFIADIASNHDRDLSRALDLISQAAEAGADAAKFQHFRAKELVSDYGFKRLKNITSHQSNWQESVFKTYEQNELPWEWTEALKERCAAENIEFMTSPYDMQAIDLADLHVNAFKIGSGDISWLEEIEYICTKQKPIIIATGASTEQDVKKAVQVISNSKLPYCLMQCNTNYTGIQDNVKFLNLNVIQRYSVEYPDAILGLSDHTSGHTSVLGAISLGARVIEKHFTDSNDRVGPDHPFSMSPSSWKDMISASRELEEALGDGIKKIEDNERGTYILQRRSLRYTQKLKKGDIVERCHLSVLRPNVPESLPVQELSSIIGKKIICDVSENDSVHNHHF